jgi:hypothetical protein
MKITIGSLVPVDRPIYKDIIWSGKEKKNEIDAPILQFYRITLIETGGISHSFDTEVRRSPNGEQVDWYEDLDDFLFAIESRADANILREKICMVHYDVREGVGVRFPIIIDTEAEQAAGGDAAR